MPKRWSLVAVLLTILLAVLIAFSTAVVLSANGNPNSFEKKAFAFEVVNDEDLSSKYENLKIKIAVPAIKKNGEKGTRKWLEDNGIVTETVTSADADISEFDGMVIPGGGDVDPDLYGQEPDNRNFGTNRQYDEMEIELIKRFAQQGKPVLGICRGCQVINVCFGGTLDQHITGWHKKNRNIDVEEGSWLFSLMGANCDTYHYHHQRVCQLGQGLVATQWDEKDGGIEGIEHEEFKIYGLQWHPEGMEVLGPAVARAFADECMESRDAI